MLILASIIKILIEYALLSLVVPARLVINYSKDEIHRSTAGVLWYCQISKIVINSSLLFYLISMIA
jgi:hypothetical protein